MNSINYLGVDIPLDCEKTWDYLSASQNLKGIFQLETSAAASSMKKFKPKNINDLATLGAINRPGALQQLDKIVRIRDGKQAVEYPHERLKPILESTLGSYIFQEQLMLTATQLAGYTAKDSAKYLKILGKKQPEELLKQESIFIDGMVKNGFERKFAKQLFDDLKGFANYGFNRCCLPDTAVATDLLHEYKLLVELEVGDYVLGYDSKKQLIKHVRVKKIWESEVPVYKIKTEGNHVVSCSPWHKFLCEDGKMRDISSSLSLSKRFFVLGEKIPVYIKKIKRLGIKKCIDIEVDDPCHNFVLKNGLVSSNSHAISYGLFGYVCAYLKVHYPLQFFRSILNFSQFEMKPLSECSEIIEELPAFNINILPPSITKLTNQFEIEHGAIRYPLGLVKNIGEAVYEKLKSLSPEQTRTLDSVLESFLNLSFNSRSVESMIICGALEDYKMAREDVLLYYWFLSGLQDEVATKFWHFKNGHQFSRELINNFLNYVSETETNQGDMFQGGKKKNTKGYFKSEATRLKTIEAWQKNCALVDSYKQKLEMCYFFWENKVLGYSNHCQFNANIKLFKDFETMKTGEAVWSCGFVDETKFRNSAKGNPYAIVTLRYDKKREFMLFREISEGAKGTLKAGDFVKFNVKKEENNLKVESISIINNERTKYAFYE